MTYVLAGLAGGLVGGVAFGVLMQLTDIMLMVAMLVGSTSEAIGWLVHVFNSLLFGLLYAVLFGRWMDGHDVPGVPVIIGLAYGWSWWLISGMVIMPGWLGTPDMIMRFNATAWQSLGGHTLYGLLLGIVFTMLKSRLEHSTAN